VPPRYAYWTIVVDNQPTAFRAGLVEEIMPTFNRLKAKQPSAVLKWFQNGKLWDSQRAAREAQERRGEEGRNRDKNRRTGGAPRQSTAKLDWKPKETSGRQDPPKLEWSPRGTPTSPRPERRDRPQFKSSMSQRDAKPWGAKPRDTRDRPKLDWSPRGTPTSSRPERRDRPPYKGGASQRDSKSWGGKSRDTRDRPKLDWSPPQAPAKSRPEKPARQPYKGSTDQPDAKRDAKWRPGGEHRDPRQKYKDAKKAKWTRFKQAIRGRRTPRKP
jgi:hypothetical protein